MQLKILSSVIATQAVLAMFRHHTDATALPSHVKINMEFSIFHAFSTASPWKTSGEWRAPNGELILHSKLSTHSFWSAPLGLHYRPKVTVGDISTCSMEELPLCLLEYSILVKARTVVIGSLLKGVNHACAGGYIL